jgi:sodium-dependent phosphate cotransporter
MGKEFAERLIRATSNPCVALFVGILATSIVQSSSLTTSIVVGMVSAGTLTVRCAIPIVMGANIGTTVTNTIVSLGFITRRHEFRKAFACGTVHDFFNFLCVLTLLPLELLTQNLFGTGFLEGAAGRVGSWFTSAGRFRFAGPVQLAVKPLEGLIREAVQVAVGKGLLSCWVCVVLAFVLLFLSLWGITKLMRSLMLDRLGALLDQTVGRSALLGLAVGLVITAIIQSSSITTSILVPLAAAGIVDLNQVFPVTVGANIGTTMTALMASLGGNPAGLTIALVHLLFNTVGAAMFLPFPPLRAIPIALAERLAALTLRSRWYSVAYVTALFYMIPGLLIFLT